MLLELSIQRLRRILNYCNHQANIFQIYHMNLYDYDIYMLLLTYLIQLINTCFYVFKSKCTVELIMSE